MFSSFFLFCLCILVCENLKTHPGHPGEPCEALGIILGWAWEKERLFDGSVVQPARTQIESLRADERMAAAWKTPVAERYYAR